ALAREGAVVVCADLLDAGSVAASLPKAPDGRAGKAIRLDVTLTPDVEQAIAQTVEEYGALDILANNAGVAQPIREMVDTPDEVIERVFAVNVKGLIACSRAAGRVRSEEHTSELQSR